MYRTLLVAAAVPIALGYSYDYADAPTAAPTRTFSPTTHEPTTSPFAADNDSIREAVRFWLDYGAAAAEAMYGHISMWETGGVRTSAGA